MLAIFDFDGTLFDSSPEWVKIIEISMIKNKVEIPFGIDFYSEVKPLGLKKAAKYLKNKYRWEQSADEVAHSWIQIMRQLYSTKIPLKKGAMQYIKQLKNKGVKICIATAMENDLVEISIERVGLKSLVDAVVTTNDLNTDKNSSKIYYYCMEMFSESKKNTYIYEDSPDAAKMCIAEGFRVVGVYDGQCKDDIAVLKPVCEYFIQDFRDENLFGKVFI